jgi:hypothetical protein
VQLENFKNENRRLREMLSDQDTRDKKRQRTKAQEFD